jgi:hypothetical protein
MLVWDSGEKRIEQKAFKVYTIKMAGAEKKGSNK